MDLVFLLNPKFLNLLPVLQPQPISFSHLKQSRTFFDLKFIGWVYNPGLFRGKWTILISTNDVDGFFITLIVNGKSGPLTELDELSWTEYIVCINCIVYNTSIKSSNNHGRALCYKTFLKENPGFHPEFFRIFIAPSYPGWSQDSEKLNFIKIRWEL